MKKKNLHILNFGSQINHTLTNMMRKMLQLKKRSQVYFRSNSIRIMNGGTRLEYNYEGETVAL